MKINTIEVAKEVFKDKELIIKDIEKNKVEINYKAKRGNYNRKTFTLPKELIINEKFIEGMGLYLGDGDNHRKEKAHLTFTSKDKDIIKFFIEFLRSYFNIQNKDITISIKYKQENANIKKEWSKTLCFNEERILTKYSDRNKEESCDLQVNGIVFRYIFEEILKKIIKSRFLHNRKLRQAFIRGIFAAEGNIGIEYTEIKPYITQIIFSISIKEIKLKRLICSALKLENINYRINKNYKQHCLNIIITNWKNYLKLWNIKTFDLCQRKNIKFRDISKNLNIYLKLRKEFRENFFKSINLSQRKIANLIASWQANVSKTIKGDHLLRIEQFVKLLHYSKFNKENILKNLEEIRIGSLTSMKSNKEILDFIKEFKSF